MPDRDAYLVEAHDKLIAQSTVETYRASGPGGQHRNKTDSAVRLTHRPTGVVVTATERRSQHENRHRAIVRLRKAIAVRIREPVEPCATAGLTGRAALTLPQAVADPAWPRISQKSDTYLVVAAQVLDHVESCEGKISDAALRLGTSTASLVKFLSLDDDLWQEANRTRRRFGQKPLR